VTSNVSEGVNYQRMGHHNTIKYPKNTAHKKWAFFLEKPIYKFLEAISYSEKVERSSTTLKQRCDIYAEV